MGTSRACRRPWAGRDAAAALHDGGTPWPDRSGAPARAPPRLGQRACASRAAGRAAGAWVWGPPAPGRGGRLAGRGRRQPARRAFGPPLFLRACSGAPPPLAAQARALSALPPGPGRCALTRRRSPLPGCPGCAAHLAGGERAPGEGGRRGAEARAQLVRVHRALVRADELGAGLQVRHRLPRRIVSFLDTSRSPWRPACSRSPRPRTPPPPAPLRPARPDQRRCPQRQPQTGASSSAPGCATRFKTR